MGSDRTLQATFEARGRFWRPEKQDLRIDGVLRYAAGSIELELFGSFTHRLGGNDVSETELTLGWTEVGPCTLWNLIRTRAATKHFMEVGAEGQLPHSKWLAHHIYLGAHFERADEIGFTSVSFGFDCLERWLTRLPFEVNTEGDPANHPITTARHAFPDPPAVELPSQNAKLEFDFVFTRGGEFLRSIVWEQEAGLKVVPSEPQHINWFLERLGDLHSFLGLLVGEGVTPTRIWGRVPNVRGSVEVFFAYVGKPLARPLHPAEMIVTGEKLGERLASTVAAWVEKRDRLQTTISLLFGTLYTPDLPGEFRFLALAQALETFHRRTRGGLFLPQEEYEPIKQSLTDAIPSDIPTDLCQALTARIGYGNELSLRRRFREMTNSLGEPSRGLVSSDPEFVDRVVEERNHLTHYPDDESPPMEPEELYYASVRLRALLTLLLLREIGVVGAEAVEGLRRTRWYRGLQAR